jgi:hypothetical protein
MLYSFEGAIGRNVNLSSDMHLDLTSKFNLFKKDVIYYQAQGYSTDVNFNLR